MIRRNVKCKNIIIKSSGVLKELNGAIGPILTPFKCDIRKIKDLVNNNKKVFEVADGKQVELTVRNYDDFDLFKPNKNNENNNNQNSDQKPNINAEQAKVIQEVENHEAAVQNNKQQDNVKYYNNENNKQKNKNNKNK